MRDGIKVLFITSTFPVDKKDTLAPWIGTLVRKIKSQDIDIEVFAPSYSGIEQNFYYNIPVHRFRYAPSFLESLVAYDGALAKLRKNRLFYFISLFYIFFGLIAVLRKVKKNTYQIIHVNWALPHGFFGIFAKLFSSSRLIITFYGAEFALADHIPFGRAMLRFIIKRADVVVAISNSTKRKVQELENVQVRVIPLTSPIQPTKKNAKYKNYNNQHKKNILFVGRLIERKGLPYLVDAINNIPLKENVHLDIVGEGPVSNVIQEKINSLNLSGRVTLHGRVSEKQLNKLYDNCTMFVLPAITDKWGDTEGLGVVILEAMSYSKPVIASRVGGIVDIVKDNVNGILVPEKNSIELRRAILLILHNKRLRENLSRNGFKTVKHSFSWDNIIFQLKKLYVEVLNLEKSIRSVL